MLRCHEGSVLCVLPLLAIADSSEACLIMTASAEGTMRVSHHCTTLVAAVSILHAGAQESVILGTGHSVDCRVYSYNSDDLFCAKDC